MKGLRLDHATINTADVAATVAFYSRFLGMKPGWRPRLNVDGVWLYAQDGDYPILHLIERLPLAGVGMFDHIAFRGCDLQSYLSKLRAAGCWFHAKPVNDTPYTQVHHYDPNGVKIEVVFEEPLGSASESSDGFEKAPGGPVTPA